MQQRNALVKAAPDLLTQVLGQAFDGQWTEVHIDLVVRIAHLGQLALFDQRLPELVIDSLSNDKSLSVNTGLSIVHHA